jgi:hypothetical protein
MTGVRSLQTASGSRYNPNIFHIFSFDQER